nr:DUF4157 domain-containing protein [Pseudenhygromyxa sp. WMMC2535]
MHALQAKADASASVQRLHALQRMADGAVARGGSRAGVREAARMGVSGRAHALPHAGAIQRAFGRHSLDGVEAHTDAAAVDASRSLRAEAYTVGPKVAFASSRPTLHTAAHEAAHVIQQRAGLRPAGGVGIVGDALERHADAVADAVVGGSSAEGVLDRLVGGAGGQDGGGAQSVQRKAVIGPNYDPAQRGSDARNAVIDDDVMRRFEDDDELDRFARGDKLEVAGEMPDKTWIRMDEFTVLGEYHTNQLAPGIIKALGTEAFRYEGFSEYDDGLVAGDDALRESLDESREKFFQKHGIDPDDGDHSAEHVLPKFARCLPDVESIALKQGREDAENAIKPGAAMGEGYSLNKALISSFVGVLKYLRSYENLGTKSPLENTANEYHEDVVASIAVLEVAADNDVVPDLSKVGMATGAGMAAMKAAFRSEARKTVGLEWMFSRYVFKMGLKIGGLSNQSLTNEANENDYLRDKSMFMKILSAKKMNERLFVIGDAHRSKLSSKLRSKGIRSMRDKDYLEEEAKNNEFVDYDAAGISRGVFNVVDQLVVDGGLGRLLVSKKVPGSNYTYNQAASNALQGQAITLPALPQHCSYVANSGGTINGVVLTRTTGTLDVSVVFQHGGIRKEGWVF